MIRRIGIFVDLSNMFYCVKRKYSRKINYREYYKFIDDLGNITMAHAYGAQIKDEAEQFIKCLQEIGFTTHYKMTKEYNLEGPLKRKADWDVGIAMDIMDNIEELDIVILGCADGDLLPIVQRVIDANKQVIIFAAGISKDLKIAATRWIELTEDHLE